LISWNFALLFKIGPNKKLIFSYSRLKKNLNLFLFIWYEKITTYNRIP
jgi:hypothetical protein